jgi:hypothetical protein
MTFPAASTLLAEFAFERRPVERGYANRTTYVNLTENTIYEKPVTHQVKDLSTFVFPQGGRATEASECDRV